jgi:hypothetical protein
MDTVTLDALRREHFREFIGPLLDDLLRRVVRATAPTYPPDYAPGGAWNQASLEDVYQQWVEDRLWGRRDLTRMLGGAKSKNGLRRALTRSLRQFLTNSRVRSSASNLYKRMIKLLETDSTFKPVSRASKIGESRWALAGGATEPSKLSLRELVRRAHELSDRDLKVVRYNPESAKSSPILRKAYLRRFLVHVLRSAEGSLDAAQISEIIIYRFNLFEPSEVAISADLKSLTPSTEAIVSAELAATMLEQELMPLQPRVVGDVGPDLNFTGLAQRMRLNEMEVWDAYLDAMHHIKEVAQDATEVEAILRCLRERHVRRAAGDARG